MGNALRVTADLFGSPLIAVEGSERALILDKLREQGNVIELRGRGRSTVYVNRDASSAVIARRNILKNGRKSWTFQRIGAFTRRELAYLHSLHA